MNYKIQARIVVVLAITLLYVLFTRKPVNAAEYLFDEGTNNTFSQAQEIILNTETLYVYGILTGGQETVDYYHLRVNKPQPQVKIALMVSQKNNTFTPSLILGDSRNSRMSGDVPFSFPGNLGGTVYNWDGNRAKQFTDEHVIEDFNVGASTIKNLSPGTYTFAIFNPAGRLGRYTLMIGKQGVKDEVKNQLNRFISFLRIKLLLY